MYKCMYVCILVLYECMYVEVSNLGELQLVAQGLHTLYAIVAGV